MPAYDEERLVGETIRGIPEFVDRILVVDDASRDGTPRAAEAVGDPRVDVLRHERNEGVGAAIATGYRRALEEEIDVTCVMAADNQMDPASSRVSSSRSRAATSSTRRRTVSSRVRRGRSSRAPATWGTPSSRCSRRSRRATGTSPTRRPATRRCRSTRSAVSTSALYPRYGFPNDMLVHLNVQNARVRDVPSRPIYDVGERSGIKLRSVVPRISWLLFKGFWWRMGQKYVIRDFHPLVFFYVFGVAMLGVGFVLGLVELVLRIAGNAITPATIVLVAVLVIAGLQMTLFAMWFDMEANKDLR